MYILGFKVSNDYKDTLELGEIINVNSNIDSEFRLELDFEIKINDIRVLEIGLGTGRISCRPEEYIFTYYRPIKTKFVIVDDYYEVILEALSLESFDCKEFDNMKNGDIIHIKCITEIGKYIPKRKS